ncbi:hypothetical protein ACFQ4C_01620 [Larkinella insperata]|uniref:Phage protein n=1 Tax=Larkinella insperata TaxID=332158 RepID=A0ABW3QC44_9BACT|nr:hypothetical protein [Larkinella insperata]
MFAATFRFYSNWMQYRETIRLHAQEYEKALGGTDKEYARLVGYSYFSALRRGCMTKEDVEVVEGDLSMM